MTEFVTSADGSRIAFDRDGEGPAVILIGGAMQFRAFDPTTVEPPAAESIVATLPNARLVTIPASEHGWEPGVMAPRLAEFFGS